MLAEGLIVEHEDMGKKEQKLRRLVLKGPFAQIARPGQFVSLQVQDSARASRDPLLRRPISIAEFSPERSEITLLYRIKGRGTEILAQARCGDQLSVLGPLGNGFSLPESRELWLAAGGIGIFPLYPLAQSALAQGLKVRLFWGGENRGFLKAAGLPMWQELRIQTDLWTMDGSCGRKGLTTQGLAEALQERDAAVERPAGASIAVAACGPKPMLQAVSEISGRFQVPLEISLEERMGCAVGACLGCVCTIRDAGGNLMRKKVCLDGPVFRGEEVVWDADC